MFAATLGGRQLGSSLASFWSKDRKRVRGNFARKIGRGEVRRRATAKLKKSWQGGGSRGSVTGGRARDKKWALSLLPVYAWLRWCVCRGCGKPFAPINPVTADNMPSCLRFLFFLWSFFPSFTLPGLGPAPAIYAMFKSLKLGDRNVA